MTQTFHRPKSSLKRTAPRGELRNLTTSAREQLHSWFREGNGTITYREIRKRLKDVFDINVAPSSLSKYYNQNFEEIQLEPGQERQLASAGKTKTIVVIRIEVPAGVTPAITTEEQA
jgi:hypothetical protein